MAFVMVLSWSRQIYLRFFLDARMDSFLAGHAGAFAAWSGLPRILLYDNLRSAVLERQGDAIRFNPTLLAFAAHHRFEPRPVAVARGNEKGRVERAIRYVRESFLAARKFADLDDLNIQAAQWCAGMAADRPCREEPTITVREAFAREQPSLLTLPADDRAHRRSDRTRGTATRRRSRAPARDRRRGGGRTGSCAPSGVDTAMAIDPDVFARACERHRKTCAARGAR
ncbi:hypothetical protein OKW50_008229 [Paraburkholderia youngii]